MLNIRRRTCILALALLSLLALASCTSATATSVATLIASPTSGGRMPTALRVTRFAGPPENHVAPFDAQTNQADKVQRLFAAMRALPPFVPTVTCPYDQGGGYLLTFQDSVGIMAQAIIPVGGCLALEFSKPYGCHRFTGATVDQVADTLGIRHTDLIRMAAFWDSASPGGPMAPVEPSEPLLPFSPCH